ncbi:MAG: hypothetical protein WC136_00425 [Sphaerochaeta sp.]|jgi:hypothetical protein
MLLDFNLNDQFIRDIQNYYISKFYKLHDTSHGVEHIEDVLTRCQIILGQKALVDKRNYFILLLASYIHDAFSEIDRDNHHLLAGDYVLQGDNFINLLNSDEKQILWLCVVNHRASKNYPIFHHSILPTIFRIADKDEPDIYKIVFRIFMYNIKIVSSAHVTVKDGSSYYNTYPDKLFSTLISDNLLKTKIYDHLVEKFGRDGYLFKGDSEYKEYYKDQLQTLFKTIDSITVDNLEDYISFSKFRNILGDIK